MPLYVGIDGVARKAKKLYVGVGDVARKVKRAYVGVNGIATRFYIADADKSVVYKGTTTQLSVARGSAAAATIADEVAFFAGGFIADSVCSAVDAYNSALTKFTPNALFAARSDLAGAANGEYALFAGGNETRGSSDDRSAIVDAYSDSFVHVSPLSLSTNRCLLAAAVVGEYILFAGGVGSIYYDTVDAYNQTLTRSIAPALSMAVCELAAGSVDGYAFFAGGRSKNSSETNRLTNVVNAYSPLLGRSLPSGLREAKRLVTGISFNETCIFVGGQIEAGASSYSDANTEIVDAYTESLVRISAAAVSIAFNDAPSATIKNQIGLCGGGAASDSRIMTAYTPALTRINAPSIQGADENEKAATHVNGYALFAGGQLNGGYYSDVQVFIYE